MRIDTVETKVYKFSELSEAAKEKAIKGLYDINVDYDWSECTFEDAGRASLRLTEFDIGRGNYCKGNFVEDSQNTAIAILKGHGRDCETHKTATEYLKKRAELVKKYSDGKNINTVTEDNEYDFDNDCDDLDAEFLRSILEDYRIILQKEYEYQTSEKSIIETIEANEYEFTEDGKLY